MTHHTDAQLLPCPFCGSEAHFEMDDDRWEWIECGSCGMQGNRSASLMEDCKPKLAEAWNRRAPAATVVQGWRDGVLAVADMLKKKADAFADAYGYDDMGGLSFGQGSHADAKLEHHSNLLELEEEVRAMLAAEHQPPAAAPVELPEPFTTLVRKNSWSPNSYEASPRSNHHDYGRQWADERINVFAEQQVRDLLAAHGIGKDKQG